MVSLTVASVTSALLLTAISPFVEAAPSPITFFNANSAEFIARDQLEARYEDYSTFSQLDRRYYTTFKAPTGYSTDYWGIDGKRLCYGTASCQYINRSTISGARSVGQNEVNACATLCNKTNNCKFFHPIQMNGGGEGNVVCALYNSAVAKSAATWTTGPGSTGGTVVTSYGFTRITTTPTTTSSSSVRTSTSSTSSASTTSSRTSSASSTSSRTSTASGTSTSTSTSSTATLPAAPAGATLRQFRGCSSSTYTVPMFVNKNYPLSGSTSASTVWIVQHGSTRNFDDYFSSVYNVVGDEGVVIAPNFYSAADTGRWYQPDKNLAWSGNEWFNGADTVKPSGLSCSSFDVYDALLAHVRDPIKFPKVNRVFVVAHSAGASMTAKYGMLNSDTGIKYVLANSPSMPYFTEARPNPDSAQQCFSTYDSWGYGYDAPMPRYVAARNPGGVNAFRNWIVQDLTIMTGTYDTYSRDQTGDQSCPVQAQGGQNRRDRGYAWWAYINLLGGTSTDVTDFYGYDQFQEQSVSSLNPPSFGARYCVVPGVAHDNDAMFASDCGRAAINGAATIPEGPGPVRPA